MRPLLRSVATRRPRHWRWRLNSEAHVHVEPLERGEASPGNGGQHVVVQVLADEAVLRALAGPE
eukprot:6674268-Alexandrium_andersonii.AAC.1